MSQQIQHFLDKSDYQDFDARINLIKISNESSSTNLKFLIEILMEEVKLVVTEKVEFEFRGNSKLKSLCRHYDYIIPMESSKQQMRSNITVKV